MEHHFDLPITHKGEQLVFKARLVTFAYEYKFYIIVAGKELTFERDDNGEIRVLSLNDNNLENIDSQLVVSIVDTLGKLQAG